MALYSSGIEYALHCLLYLVEQSPEHKASCIDLAELQGISPTYLAKLLTQLKASGLITASEGTLGGYQLARPPAQITVLDVVTALEGHKPLFDCKNIRLGCAVFGAKPPPWASAGVCSIHAVMLEAEARMKQTLANHSLADLSERVAAKAPRAFLLDIDGWFAARRAMKNQGAKRRNVKKKVSNAK